MRLVDDYRVVAFLARRQYGKTTTFAKIALKKMMKQRDHTVIFGSAKLGLSREIVRKEAQILQAAIGQAVQQATEGAVQVAQREARRRVHRHRREGRQRRPRLSKREHRGPVRRRLDPGGDRDQAVPKGRQIESGANFLAWSPNFESSFHVLSRLGAMTLQK